MDGLNAKAMRDILGKHENQTTLVEELTVHSCFFPPKFLCELNAIERVWCHAKNHARKYVNGSIVRLRTVVPYSMNTCDSELICKFLNTCREYMRAYQGGALMWMTMSNSTNPIEESLNQRRNNQNLVCTACVRVGVCMCVQLILLAHLKNHDSKSVLVPPCTKCIQHLTVTSFLFLFVGTCAGKTSQQVFC